MAPLSKKNRRIRAAMSLTTRVVQCALEQEKSTWCNYVQIVRLNAKRAHLLLRADCSCDIALM
eukprot:12978628-Heterocapsa_arctica.AAC.1